MVMGPGAFGSAANLSDAYGMAVTTTMLITTIILLVPQGRAAAAARA